MISPTKDDVKRELEPNSSETATDSDKEQPKKFILMSDYEVEVLSPAIKWDFMSPCEVTGIS